jgi:hypothetical protein
MKRYNDRGGRQSVLTETEDRVKRLVQKVEEDTEEDCCAMIDCRCNKKAPDSHQMPPSNDITSPVFGSNPESKLKAMKD